MSNQDEQSETNQSKDITDNQELTPWQQENLKYLNEKGKAPSWIGNQNIPKVEKLTFEEEDILADDDQPNNKQNKLVVLSGDSKQTEKTDEERKIETNGKPKDLPKSKSYADKLPKMKEERKQRLRRRLFTIVGVFGVATLLLMYYVSPISKLEALEVVGNDKVSKEAIAAATTYTEGEFFWKAFFDKNATAGIKEQNPRIKSVSKGISHINNIKLTVTEYNDIGYAKNDGKYFAIIENGMILNEEPIEKNDDAFPVFTNFENGKNIKRMVTFYNNLTDDIKKKIIEIVYSPTEFNKNKIIIRMNDENQVIGSILDIDEKIIYYNDVAGKMSEPGVVDMEAGIYTYSFETKESHEKEKAKQDELNKQQDELNKQQDDLEQTNEDLENNNE